MVRGVKQERSRAMKATMIAVIVGAAAMLLAAGGATSR
jgi:hypothetical protein